MEVNYWGAVALTQAALGPLLQRRGQIIVLSSIAGFAPLLARSGYCASKHALHGFFDTLRTELHGSGVHITLVCPSFVDTDFANHGLRGDGRRLDFERSTSGRPLTADQVAQAILRASRSRPRQVVLSPLGRLSYWLTRWAPAWYDRLMIRRFRVELARPRTVDSPTPWRETRARARRGQRCLPGAIVDRGYLTGSYRRRMRLPWRPPLQRLPSSQDSARRFPWQSRERQSASRSNRTDLVPNYFDQRLADRPLEHSRPRAGITDH